MTAPTRLLGAADPFAFSSSLMYDALEHVPDLQPGPQQAAVYARMRRESRLSAILQGYALQIRRSTWRLDPAGCRPEVVKLVADDLGLSVVGDDAPGAARTTGVSWNEHLRSALMMLPYGHMDHELLAEVDDSGKARLVALAERMPHTVSQIESDPKTGKLLGITQESIWNGPAPQIPADRLAHYVHDKEGSWSGTSLFRPSWAPFYLKTELLKIHATSARRFAMGVPTVEWAVGTQPTPAQMTAAEQVATQARAGESAGAAMPPGASLILRGLQGSVVDVLAFVKFLNSEMAIAAMMPHIDLGTSETGSRAVAGTFVESWLLALASIADEVADVATRQIAARIVGWNWENEPVPRVVCSGIGAQRDVTAESLNLLLTSGALSPDPKLEEYIRREWHLPERDPNTPFKTPGADVKPPATPEAEPDADPDKQDTAEADADPVKNANPVKAAAKSRSLAEGQLTLFAAAPQRDFAQIQQQWEQTKARLLKRWPKLAGPMIAELADQAEAAAAAGDLAQLGDLAVSAGVLAAVAVPLKGSGSDLAQLAAADVVREAAGQGKDVKVPDLPGNERVRQTADAVARIIANGYASGAGRAALQLAGAEPAEVRAAVEAHLVDLGDSENGLVGDNVGALLSAAQHAGRLAVLEQNPADSYEAVEVNDKARCVPCSKISSTRFDTLAEALKAYPSAGYRGCVAGSRCRGFISPVWR